jgi:hypothetical protein
MKFDLGPPSMLTAMQSHDDPDHCHVTASDVTARNISRASK